MTAITKTPPMKTGGQHLPEVEQAKGSFRTAFDMAHEGTCPAWLSCEKVKEERASAYEHAGRQTSIAIRTVELLCEVTGVKCSPAMLNMLMFHAKDRSTMKAMLADTQSVEVMWKDYQDFSNKSDEEARTRYLEALQKFKDAA